MDGIKQKCLNKLIGGPKKNLKRLQKKRQHIIDNALHVFEVNYPEESTDELRTKLETEANRIYDFIGHSILKEGLKRTKYYFWAVTLVALIVALGIFFETHASAVIFISPLMAGLARWAVSVATIPISCNERVIGGMEGVVNAYIRELKKNHNAEKKRDSTQEMIAELKIEISTLK